VNEASCWMTCEIRVQPAVGFDNVTCCDTNIQGAKILQVNPTPPLIKRPGGSSELVRE
jgi:hypothetical protein